MVQIEYVYRLNLFHCPPSEPGLLKAPQKASKTVKEYFYSDAKREERGTEKMVLLANASLKYIYGIMKRYHIGHIKHRNTN